MKFISWALSHLYPNFFFGSLVYKFIKKFLRPYYMAVILPYIWLLFLSLNLLALLKFIHFGAITFFGFKFKLYCIQKLKLSSNTLYSE